MVGKLGQFAALIPEMARHHAEPAQPDPSRSKFGRSHLTTTCLLHEPDTFQAALKLWYRGPDFAFAIPEGDLDALERTVSACSQFWNGANSLIIPVRPNGRTWALVESILTIRPVEACFVDPSVSKTAANRVRERLGARVGQWVEMSEDFDSHELHPLLLQPSYSDPSRRRQLEIPQFAGARLRRIRAVCWGHIHPGNQTEYERAFSITSCTGDDAFRALLEGQVTAACPTEQSVRLMQPYQTNPSMQRCLWLFDRPRFSELTHFWNLRTVTREFDGRPLIAGAPREIVRRPRVLNVLLRWIRSNPYFDVDPDLTIIANKSYDPIVDDALREIGLTLVRVSSISRTFGAQSVLTRVPRYAYGHPTIGGAVQRGAVTQELVTFVSGKATLRLTQPKGFGSRGAHYRLAVDGLPLSMPLSDAAAAATRENGYRSPEGVTFVTTAAPNSLFDLRLPTRWTDLTGWLGDEFRPKWSQAGRYAQALLDRLNGWDGLDALANETTVAVLEALAPTSRKKLAQRLVAQAQRVGRRLDETTLSDLLIDKAQFLELRALTLEQIAAERGFKRPQILRALVPLVQHSFVRRGFEGRCTRCGFAQIITFARLDEQIECNACRQEFDLPVADTSLRRESAVAYQLDGLMARIMDQDLLPVLLTMRQLRNRLRDPVRSIWPGLELIGAHGTTEVDLLMSDGVAVWVTECKVNADLLPDEQLDRLLEVAQRTGARPAVGALSGRVTDVQEARLLDHHGAFFDRSSLLDC